MGKTMFVTSTYRAIQQFREGIEKIQKQYPEVTFKEIRDYIQSKEEIPEEVKEIVDVLEAKREAAIKNEMQYVEAKAHSEGKNIPEKYLNGTALDPVFGPSTYAFSGTFEIYEFFSWYMPDEVAEFAESEVYSM